MKRERHTTGQTPSQASSDPSLVAELKELSKEDLTRWAEDKISDTLHDLCNYNPVASQIASTNAIVWGLDVFDISDIEVADDEIRVQVQYQLCGDQEDDKPWCGTEIFGEALGHIDSECRVTYTDITAERDLGDYDYDPETFDGDLYLAAPQPTARVIDPFEQIKQYLAQHPEKIYNLTPRKFEELIASILTDLGFETELTKVTRDGGRDMYAYVKNAVTSFLMFVECKKWSPKKKVGIEIVQRVHGAARSGGAHKSMIVTTSFFSLPAQQEHHNIAKEMELKDFNELKKWLSNYK
jgi:hypothetical protein